ncbi:MAG: peroxiredoxin [Leptospiraceae bacterium]|nr:peroxiredoxin [Leptospiraceae bacterium]MCK6379975.1 peroxiredoxin [Leptospiraceae bacterium]NUM40064.1 peroxiredoxin [Leptospiraceae bacterium]
MSLLGKQATEFELPDTNGNLVSLKNYIGKKVLLVFYPGDNTMVCTKQLCSYSDGFDGFRQIGIEIIGINKNTVNSHKEFGEKYNFKFPLLSDVSGKICDAYGASGLLGTKRAMFLVDETGKIILEDITLPVLYKNSEEVLELIQKVLKK